MIFLLQLIPNSLKTHLMRFFSLILLFCSIFSVGYLNAQDQEIEIGLMAGAAIYSGDLSPQEFGLYTDDVNPAGGLYIRYRPANRLALRFNALFGRLSAEDEDFLPGDVREGNERALKFRTNFSEFSLLAEFDLFYIGDKNDNHLALYLQGGGGIVSYNPEGNLNGEWVELQPLRTEGQGVLNNPNYDPAPYALNEFVPVFGGGLRWRLSPKVTLGLEIAGRRVASDYIDDVSNTTVDFLDILENTGSLGAEFSNPNISNPTDARRTTYVRGGEFSDWYFQGGLTVGIILGEGNGNGQMGCYKF